MSQTVKEENTITTGFKDEKILINENLISYCITEKATSKSTFLFLHGAYINKETMKPLAYAFNQSQSVLIDLPGHGLSSGTSKSSVSEYADIIRIFINKLLETDSINDNIILIGWSMGGSIALKLSLQSIPQIKKVVLINSSPEWHLPELPRESFDLKMLFTASFTSSTPSEAKESIINNLPLYASSLDTCIIDTNTVNSFKIDAQLGEISMPVLIISGDADFIVPIEKQDFMKSHLPNARIEIFSDRGHCLLLESPTEVAAVIKAFLSTN